MPLWPKSIVYCYGHNLTLEVHGVLTTTQCPTYAFAVNTNTTYYTSDGRVKHQGGTKQRVEWSRAELDTQAVHFADFKSAHKEITDSLTKIANLQKNYTEATTITEVAGRPITYRGVTIYGALCAGGLLDVILTWKVFGSMRRLPWPRCCSTKDTVEERVARQVDLRLSQFAHNINRAQRSQRPPIRYKTRHAPSVDSFSISELRS